MRRSWRARPPWGLVGMLALIAAGESFIAGREPDLTHKTGLAWRWAGRAAVVDAPGNDVLCLGDSLVKLGLIPALFEARGLRAFNLAVPGGQPASTLFLLRRALDAGARPRAIVVDFHPNLLASAPRTAAAYWPHLVGARECLDLAWNAHDPRLGLAMLLGSILPSQRDRDEIRTQVREALAGRDDGGRQAERVASRRNWRRNRGAHVAPVLGQLLPDEFPLSEKPGRWRPYPANEAYLRRVLDLAAARGIAVYWLMPPVTPDWLASRERRGLEADYTAFAASIRDRFPNVVIVDGRHSGYESPAFRDSTHLNRRGAIALSVELASIVAATTAPERWVALPRFREPPASIAVEDVEQSRRLVALGEPEPPAPALTRREPEERRR